ncbi:MAG: CBS domain-containing protein, partial [Nitrososphaera sp.]
MQADYSSRKAADVADKNPVMLDESTNLAESARLMREKQISSVLVGQYSHHVVG